MPTQITDESSAPRYPILPTLQRRLVVSPGSPLPLGGVLDACRSVAMSARPAPRPALGRPVPIHGIVPCSTAHRILLAIRSQPLVIGQIAARVGYQPSSELARLAGLGLVTRQALGERGLVYITEAGLALVAVDGPLSRRATEIIYCQL